MNRKKPAEGNEPLTESCKQLVLDIIEEHPEYEKPLREFLKQNRGADELLELMRMLEVEYPKKYFASPVPTLEPPQLEPIGITALDDVLQRFGEVISYKSAKERLGKIIAEEKVRLLQALHALLREKFGKDAAEIQRWATTQNLKARSGWTYNNGSWDTDLGPLVSDLYFHDAQGFPIVPTSTLVVVVCNIRGLLHLWKVKYS